MAPISTFRIAWLAAVLIVFVFVAVVWHWQPAQQMTGWAGRILAPASVGMHRLLGFIGAFTQRRDLARENLRLSAEADQARAAAARTAELEQENSFLRAALGLREHLGTDPVQGAVFSYLRDGGVNEMVLNRGTLDGVNAGDVVLTGQGVLVGIVLTSYDRHSILRSLDDPSMEVTARIPDSNVSGLVHSDAAQELILDLVQKGEAVSEGQSVVTSGYDQFPAGLIIGTVTSVDNDRATLFKVVRITPGFTHGWSGPVLIIHR